MSNLLSSVAGFAKAVYDIQLNTANTFVETLKDGLKNHTISGRMQRGDSLGEAIKNDFYEDTVLGQMLQGKSLNEAFNQWFENDPLDAAGLKALQAGVDGNASLLSSIFSKD